MGVILGGDVHCMLTVADALVFSQACLVPPPPVPVGAACSGVPSVLAVRREAVSPQPASAASLPSSSHRHLLVSQVTSWGHCLKSKGKRESM